MLRRHFGLNWAFVDPKTPIQQGAKFCVCVKEFLPWLMMPLQVVYVNETRATKNRGASFGFGSGTLQGHLLVTSFSLILLVFFYSFFFVWLLKI
jgi:lipoprotein signal peptidase